MIESRWLSAFYHYGGEVLSKSRFFRPLPQEFDNHRAIDLQPVLSFNAADEERGRAVLAAMGMPAASAWVCFQARDSLYHQRRGFGDSGSHRNCRIENYLAAAAEIAGRGDFADIYLLGKCKFFLCCGTGTESTPPLFGVPVAKANMLPLRPTPLGRRALYIPQLIRDAVSGDILSYFACETLGAYVYDDLSKAHLWEYPGGLEKMGVLAEENSPADIRDLCLDMYDMIEGRPADPEAVQLQAHYKRRFFSHVDDIDVMPGIGPRFCLRYRTFIEG